MKVDNFLLPPATQDLQTQAERCKKALLSLQPKIQHQKNQLFTLLYPVIVELLAKRVSQKDILAVLQAQGLKLHPSRFKTLMAEHATRTSYETASNDGTDADEAQS